MKLQQRPLPTEIDDEVPVIDLSGLAATTDRSALREPIFKTILTPGEWVIIPKGEWTRHNVDGTTSTYYVLEDRLCLLSDSSIPRDPPRYKTLAGQRVTPTRVSSLLTQNPSGTSTRPVSTCHEWDQTDEGHYTREAKKSLPQFLAETTENYYMVPELSPLRLLFKCPELNIDSDIAVYVDPKTSQASYVCPSCSHANSKELGGSGYNVRHAVPRELRQMLEAEGIIPEKKYKYADRVSEVDRLLKLISENPGESPNWLDKQISLPNGTALRLINTQLQNKVRLVKGRKHKGYRVYPN